MPGLSRSQLLVYGAIAVAVLLVGVRWVRSADASGPQTSGVTASSGGGGSSFSVDRSGGDLVVHVAGEVRSPGVYKLPLGSRVTDAIERAGGPPAAAAEDSINLAAKLADGQQVLMPAEAAGGSATGSAAATADPNAPISLGAATLEQLDTIDGIGPVTAQDILDYRDEHGGISSVEDLDQISGIGPATMEALRDRLQP